jgi:hypothetical protein
MPYDIGAVEEHGVPARFAAGGSGNMIAIAGEREPLSLAGLLIARVIKPHIAISDSIDF